MTQLTSDQVLKILSWTIGMAIAAVIVLEGKGGEYGMTAFAEALLGGLVGCALGAIFARDLKRSAK